MKHVHEDCWLSEGHKYDYIFLGQYSNSFPITSSTHKVQPVDGPMAFANVLYLKIWRLSLNVFIL